MNKEEAISIVEEVFALYEKFGDADYIGEPVSQIEHMCQAAQLAEKEGCEDEVILAAFFHDIGHLYEHIGEVRSMERFGVEDHEELGYAYLKEKGFSEKIARLVESHVPAKRYLTYRYPEYYNHLSEASKATLENQGGRMNQEEATLFEADPLFELFIKIRKWDDLAKIENVPMPSLQKYKTLALKHLTDQ
jgi:2-amino-1-hydroxyethylphosphonate dioxygenase (glycine-forming)